MPDIAMCQNEVCKLKYSCYRYIAEPNEHLQAYSNFVPEEERFCSHQIEVVRVKKSIAMNLECREE